MERALSRATGQSTEKDSDMEVVEDATESEELTDTERGLAPVPKPARVMRTKRKQRSRGLEGEGLPRKK